MQCHESCPNDGGQDNTCILVRHSFDYMPFYDFGATQIFLTYDDIYLLSGLSSLCFPERVGYTFLQRIDTAREFALHLMKFLFLFAQGFLYIAIVR